MGNLYINPEEMNYLRELAKKQLEYANLPIMKEREENWYKHNDLKGEKPMVTFEMWTCEQDLLPPPKCTSEIGKKIEHQLQSQITNHELINDDNVVPSFFGINWNRSMTLFSTPIERETATNSGGMNIGHHFVHPIKDLQDDIDILLKPTEFKIDKEYTIKYKAFVDEILGDILPTKLIMGSLGSVLTQDVVHLMGLENMMYSMFDYPDEFHKLMDRISDDYIHFFKLLESEGLLILNNGNNGLGQGSRGFSNDLPGSDYVNARLVKTENVWGFMDSQETINVSPEMFGEFVFPYYLKVAKNFGLLSYGCCEPIHPYWDDYISTLPNLRKVSISPWCDVNVK